MSTDRPAPAAIKPGRRASFVRWQHTADGWRYELVDATYLARDQDTWKIRVAGRDVRLARTVWDICAA